MMLRTLIGPPLLFPLLVACSSVNDVNSRDAQTNQAAVQTYARIARANYVDSLATARKLNERINDFLDDPTPDRLHKARDSWLDSREPYLQTEVFRFYGGPIDDENGPEGLLNSWPLDEAYIDYVDGDDDAGIINAEDTEISKRSLSEANEAGGEANIATGYHAIEFLLWGQDMDDNGPGARPASDYIDGSEGTAANQKRRRKYLATVSELLVDHLDQVANAWTDGKDNYRAQFESREPEEALSDILTGMIILSGFETGGERLQAALDSGDQEDEHSCFSDNTHRDMIQDIQGVLNVYVGSYTTVDGKEITGTGIRNVVSNFDEALAEELDARIRKSLELAENLERPFDQGIALDNDDGRAKVAALVTSLRKQEGLLEEVFRGLNLNIPQPE